LSLSLARKRAIEAEKRRMWAETSCRPRACERCKRLKPREQSRDVPHPSGRTQERICFECLPETAGN
jgi:hypothetical protein